MARQSRNFLPPIVMTTSSICHLLLGLGRAQRKPVIDPDCISDNLKQLGNAEKPRYQGLSHMLKAFNPFWNRLSVIIFKCSNNIQMSDFNEKKVPLYYILYFTCHIVVFIQFRERKRR